MEVCNTIVPRHDENERRSEREEEGIPSRPEGGREGKGWGAARARKGGWATGGRAESLRGGPTQCSAVAPPHGQQRLSVRPTVRRAPAPAPESLQKRKKRNEWPWPLTERGERERERERSSPLSDDGLTVTCGRPLAPSLPPSLPLCSLSECPPLSLCWSVCLSPLRVLSASLPASAPGRRVGREAAIRSAPLPASCAGGPFPAGWLPRWDLGARLYRTRKLFETERNIVCCGRASDARCEGTLVD